MDNEAQFVRDCRSTFNRLTDEDKKEQIRNVLLGMVAGLGLLIVLYFGLSVINAFDHAYQSDLATHELTRSETNFNRGEMK